MSEPEDITCKRCGRCCLTNLFAYADDEDMERWRREPREDILHVLENESPVWAGDRIISAKTGRDLSGCPFLSFQGEMALCSIYETRPGTCMKYRPGSSVLCPQFKVRERLTAFPREGGSNGPAGIGDDARIRSGFGPGDPMIRLCRDQDLETIYAVINDAAEAYRSVIPEDRWKDPYMSREELRNEIRDGVVFWGYEEDGELQGVMGVQDVRDVSLFRHAYVRSSRRNQGIGGRLLFHLVEITTRPILIGTWADAIWAVRFYEKHGFRRVSVEEKGRLLRKYWTIPDRQVETSVVLADGRWFERGRP